MLVYGEFWEVVLFLFFSLFEEGKNRGGSRCKRMMEIQPEGKISILLAELGSE